MLPSAQCYRLKLSHTLSGPHPASRCSGKEDVYIFQPFPTTSNVLCIKPFSRRPGTTLKFWRQSPYPFPRYKQTDRNLPNPYCNPNPNLLSPPRQPHSQLPSTLLIAQKMWIFWVLPPPLTSQPATPTPAFLSTLLTPQKGVKWNTGESRSLNHSVIIIAEPWHLLF